MVLLLLILVLLGLTVLSYRWGTDSRDGRDWTSVSAPLRWSDREALRRRAAPPGRSTTTPSSTGSSPT